MQENTRAAVSPTAKPETISRFKKERFLLLMSEDDFRDKVVRPLFLRQGLADGRDLCGPTEQGKDAVFVHVDRLGMKDFYVLQTKKGPLNLSGKIQANLLQAVTQLRTALETSIPMIASRNKVFPSKVFLCASGKVNESARRHIVDEIKDPRIVILDSDELIPKIDEHMRELWLGIDADLFPYLRAVKDLVEHPGEDQGNSDLVPSGSISDAATDSMFVQLRLHRTFLKPQKRLGQVTMVAEFEDLPVTGIISRKERMVLILGEAGAGKSTSIKRLAYILADRGLASDSTCKIPVLLRSSEIWTGKEKSLLDIAIGACVRLMKSSKASFSNEDLVAGRVVILIDSLDELAIDAARASVITKALEFNAHFPKCQIIVTSRDYAYLKTLDGLKLFTQFRLFPIDYKQAEQILKRFEKKRSLSSQKSKEILRRLQEVHGMELNPLLVTVFAATSDFDRKDVPANITELFKKYTEMMLGRWDAGKGFSQQYHAPLKDFLLTKVAYEMHRRRITSIDLDEFLLLLKTEIASRGHQAEIKQITEEILNRSGLFRVFGEKVEFRHHLLQEFFAGRGIPNKEALETVVSDEWWQRAIVFYFGENPGDSGTFAYLTKALGSRRITETYIAAVTLGLSLQACYLMNTEEKTQIFPWIVDNIAKAKDLFLKAADDKGRYPLSKFLAYYLIGRDAVACTILRDNFSKIEQLLLKEDQSREDQEIRKFWLFVGLMESGSLDQVREQILSFRPTDIRLLLAFHLGCFLLQHHRVAEKHEKKSASEICGHLSSTISHLRTQLLQEFKSELLEIRQGEIKTFELPTSAEEEAKLLATPSAVPPIHGGQRI
jgi:hypothetical protein